MKKHRVLLLLVIFALLICYAAVQGEFFILNQEELNQVLTDIKKEPTRPNLQDIGKRRKILENLITSLNEQGHNVATAFTSELDERLRNSVQKNDLVNAARLIDAAFLSLEQMVSQQQTSQDVKVESKPKQIVVYLDDEKGKVRNILGTNDPPVSPVPNRKKVPPGNRYKEIGIKYVKIGAETLHRWKYTLDSIFIDNSKDPDDKSNYDFTLVDKAIDSCLKNGITPFFQLVYDVNCYKDCGKKAAVNAEGYVPEDYDKWVEVAANIIKHFNGLFDVPRQARRYSAGDVRYFILWDEPSDWHIPKRKKGHFQYGYPTWTGKFKDFWRLYEKLIRKIETDPEIASIKHIIKIGGPTMDYATNQGGTRDKFAHKVIKTKTRLDFISQDFNASEFWNFLYSPKQSGGLKVWEDLYHQIKNSDKRYSQLEWHLNVFNSHFLEGPRQGHCNPKSPFCYPGVNFESHYGAALLTSYLIYAEGTELGSFMWHGGQGDFEVTPLVPVGYGKLFNGKAKLMYTGLAYKMFSKMLSFDDKPAIKVTSKGEEFNYSREVRERRKNKVVGYRNQDVIRILSAKSEDKKKIRILIANWNIDPRKNRYDSYNIHVKGAPDGKYNYKIFVIDKSHTFPERWTNQATWNVKDRKIFPKEVQEKMKELEPRVEELLSVYYPDRKNDRSIRYEGELGIARASTIDSKNNEINLQISGVVSSCVYLIEVNKI